MLTYLIVVVREMTHTGIIKKQKLDKYLSKTVFGHQIILTVGIRKL